MSISYRKIFDTITNIDIVIENYRIVSIDFDKNIEFLSIETIKISKSIEISSSGYPNRSINFDIFIEMYRIFPKRSIKFDIFIEIYRSFYRNPVHDRYESIVLSKSCAWSIWVVHTPKSIDNFRYISNFIEISIHFDKIQYFIKNYRSCTHDQ